MSRMTIDIEQRADPSAVDRILRALPAWFGIEEAIASYVAQASVLDSYLAVDSGHVVGVALVDRHFPESAELALIAVDPEHRATGIGRQLVKAIEQSLRDDGCRFLEVHTVGPSYSDEGYAETRAFYLAAGFSPMHEFSNLDWDGPTLILIKSL